MVIDPIPLALQASTMCLLAFEASVIEPIPFAFKASEISAVPLVLHYTSTVS